MAFKTIFNLKISPNLCLTFVTFTILLNQTSSIYPKFDACKPQSCGNGPNITFPFWLSKRESSCCGLPEFEVRCIHKDPIFTISENDYIIKSVFYANHSFVVAKAESCETPLHNVSFDKTRFAYGPNQVDFFFLYNCTSHPISNSSVPVECARSGVNRLSFAGFYEQLEYIRYSHNLSCQSVVNAPVNIGTGYYTSSSLLVMEYTEVMKMGLLLDWNADNCSDCNTSGGHCGYEHNQLICFCKDGPHLKTCNDGSQSNFPLKRRIGVAAAAAAGIGILAFCIILCGIRMKITSITGILSCRAMPKSDQNLEAFIRNSGTLALKRYAYSDVKKMTNSFKDKLGQGGFGGVYKGKLHDGQLVAVKMLNTSKGNGEDFINEVASIGKTSHVNVVTLLGFCLECSKRALIYEFMHNGSLEKFLRNDNSMNDSRSLGWEKKYKIAIDIARGLEYLHRGCSTRILHFDIKPHNILLDEEFCPKISDFGLAKLCTQKESIVSMLGTRGTIGYIAPEVFSRNFGGVSYKSDVYSYGMMVMDMVGRRKNISAQGSQSSEIDFFHCVYNYLGGHRDLSLLGVVTSEESEITRKMILVGMWCIQTIPSDRPSMSKVIEMLEGSLEVLKVPPKPFLSSPPRSPPLDFSTASTCRIELADD